MAVINPLNVPNYQSNRPVDSQGNDSRVLVKQSLATSMPSDRQTSLGVLRTESNEGSSGNYEKWKKSRIFNPKQANVAVTSENFLKAKAGLEPLYMHNIAATKLALMSIMDKDKPRFSEKVNILA